MSGHRARTGRCAARPCDLVDYARATHDIAWQLRRELHEFACAVEAASTFCGRRLASVPGDGSLWTLTTELDELADWVAHVGWAFASAGADGDASTRRTLDVPSQAVDRALERAEWNPAAHLVVGAPGEWLRVFDPLCRAYTNAGYRGSGFIQGPDGRRYPLVAPFVVRDGTEYQADDGVAPGQHGVVELDGQDPGWTTLYEATGVERHRDAPGAFERVMMGIGSTAGGRPTGSSESDVEQLVIVPGAAPMIGPSASRPPTEPSPPPYMEPKAPDFAPPARPDTEYPGNNTAVAGANGVAMLIEGVGGAAMADLGSHSGYDVVFQQNADGRVRALYKRIYVGFDDDGQPYADSAWVYGPDRGDQVPINYAG